jgi:hypothetical protein
VHASVITVSNPARNINKAVHFTLYTAGIFSVSKVRSAFIGQKQNKAIKINKSNNNNNNNNNNRYY